MVWTRALLVLAAATLGLGLTGPCMAITPHFGPHDGWVRLLTDAQFTDPKSFSILSGIRALYDQQQAGLAARPNGVGIGPVLCCEIYWYCWKQSKGQRQRQGQGRIRPERRQGPPEKYQPQQHKASRRRHLLAQCPGRPRRFVSARRLLQQRPILQRQNNNIGHDDHAGVVLVAAAVGICRGR